MTRYRWCSLGCLCVWWRGIGDVALAVFTQTVGVTVQQVWQLGPPFDSCVQLRALANGEPKNIFAWRSFAFKRCNAFTNITNTLLPVNILAVSMLHCTYIVMLWLYHLYPCLVPRRGRAGLGAPRRHHRGRPGRGSRPRRVHAAPRIHQQQGRAADDPAEREVQDEHVSRPFAEGPLSPRRQLHFRSFGGWDVQVGRLSCCLSKCSFIYVWCVRGD